MRINRISSVSLSIRILQFRFGILVVAVAIVNVRALVPVHLIHALAEWLGGDHAFIVLGDHVALLGSRDPEIPVEETKPMSEIEVRFNEAHLLFGSGCHLVAHRAGCSIVHQLLIVVALFLSCLLQDVQGFGLVK